MRHWEVDVSLPLFIHCCNKFEMAMVIFSSHSWDSEVAYGIVGQLSCLEALEDEQMVVLGHRWLICISFQNVITICEWQRSNYLFCLL